jgi:uncharacterized protein (TIGR02118 family)
MLKFVVVLYRRPDLSPEEFFANLRDAHSPLVERLPGLRRYVQNHVVPDPQRKPPSWDAVIELYWHGREAMEAAWASPEGHAATEHLLTLADLERSSSSVVAENRVTPVASASHLRLKACQDDLSVLRSFIAAIRKKRLHHSRRDNPLAIGMHHALLVVYWRAFEGGLPDRGRGFLKELLPQERTLHKELKRQRHRLAAHIGLDERFPIGLEPVEIGFGRRKRRFEEVIEPPREAALAELETILSKLERYVSEQLAVLSPGRAGH